MGLSFSLGGQAQSATTRLTPNRATSALFYPAYARYLASIQAAQARPYEGPLSAPSDPALAQRQALMASRTAEGAFAAGEPQRQAAQALAQAAGAYAPERLTTAPVQVAEARPAVMDRADIRAVGSGALDPTRIAALSNPYLEAVAGRTLQGLETARQVAERDGQSRATLANAYGGSRHGVEDALTNAAFARQASDALSGLYASGWDQAAGLAEREAGRSQAADAANAGADLETARSNAAGAQATGLANAAARNAAAQFDAAQALRAGEANQGAGLGAARLGLDSAAALASLGRDATGQSLDQAALLGQFGRQSQGDVQAGLDRDYAEWLRLAGDPYRQADAYGGLIGAIDGLYAGATRKSSGSQLGFGFGASR